MERPTVTCRAPAKINLALAVGRPRADGLHPLCSWMVTVDLYDELEVVRLPDDRFSRYAILWHEEAPRTSEIDWSIRQDLAVRAHLALESRVGRALPVQLKLDKRIPVGGGLGGGSSDAAAMLHACNTLFELGLSSDELAAIGAELGADVPFLVYGGSAIVEGVGERIERREGVPGLHAVIALPEAACATAGVYRRFDTIESGPLAEDAVRMLAEQSPASPRPDALFNDLTRAALLVAPDLEDDLARISALAERPAHVSGSGSTLFVVCDDALHAEHLARAIDARLGLPAVAVTAVAGPPVVRIPDVERSL